MFYKLLDEIFEDRNFDNWGYSRHKRISEGWII